ncbi:MAG: glycoside hydrolase family 57 protein, partial [Deferribacterota bacterium]|nr:glycoside hydrolase family 57 protein [Deferribacterota bacterium]
MKTLYLTFLWHMHQPYYKDDFTGYYELPWVFLHAIKDYYDMPRYFDNLSSSKAVFNLVPSLLMQIKEYVSPHCNDLLLNAIKKSVAKLNDQEKKQLIPQLFMANTENMIIPSLRYTELYKKYERISPDKYSSAFNNQELIDLEIHFLLAWTGVFIREEEPTIKNLIDKDAYYSDEEKTTLLNILFKKIDSIIPLYERLEREGKIELSTTPFYHPIIPLLIDINSAKEVVPNVVLPRKNISLSLDAAWHIDAGIKYFKEIFNLEPKGMWPSEGSISTKAAELFSYFGINWIASDEDVLSNSMNLPLNHSPNRSILYKKHKFRTSNGDIYIFFRDKNLSDKIGFHFANLREDMAVNIFLDELKKIYNNVDFNPHVSVILDGENAWEHYKNNGFPFLSKLYEILESENWVKLITFSDVIKEQSIPENTINNIKSGSWIYGNLLTWVGHYEKNKAWDLLAQTKEKTAVVENNLTNDEIDELKKELYIAEGSDWFWWYGDDHFTPQATTFDRLFRTHLINAHKIARITIPHNLYEPIKKAISSGIKKEPTSIVSPDIDGKITSYFEWLAAGIFNLKYDMGSMQIDTNYLKTLFWGYDNNYLFLRIDGKIKDILNK